MYWYEKSGDAKDVFLSTRVRFARNLKDYPFEPILEPALAEEIIENVSGVLSDYTADETDRNVLSEKRLISREMAEKKTPSKVLAKGDVCIMVCEEDHLRIQGIKPGFDLEGAFVDASAAETALDDKLNFAFDERLGYLTHCPTNLGCAMRASVMMFLPCLTESGKMKSIERELSKLGITVRGSGGEGSGADGCLYQMSNSVTLGAGEEEIIENLKNAVVSVAETERELRRRIKANNEDALRDRVLRAYGTAKYAYMMDSRELFRLYSDIRLGCIHEMIDMKLEAIDKILFENLPYHIIAREGGDLTPAERDKARARSVSCQL